MAMKATKVKPTPISVLTAAEEMLELLIEGREWFPSLHGTGSGARWRKRVEEVIRKARGEA